MDMWMIRKKNNDGSFSYYTYMSGITPEWVKDKNSARCFRTKHKVEKAFSEVSPYAVGAEIIKM